RRGRGVLFETKPSRRDHRRGRKNGIRSNRERKGGRTMFNRRRFLNAGTAALAAPFVPRARRAPAAESEFKLHHLRGPKAPAHTKMLAPWAAGIEQASGGRVKIEIYPAMSLGGTPPQLFGQVRDGVVDLIWTVNGYTAGLFPRSEAFELPTIFTNNIVATNLAMREMFDQHLAEEYRDVHVCFLHVHAGQAIHMADTAGPRAA